MDFLHYTLRRNRQIITDEVLCRSCYEKDPALARVSDREYAAGYRQTAEVINSPRPAICEACHAVEEITPCALCEKRAGHPYHPSLCQEHGNRQQLAIERAYWAMADAHGRAA